MNYLKEKFKSNISFIIMKELKLKSIMRVPKIYKIVISSGVKEAVFDKKKILEVSNEISLITGQKPFITIAKKSIANFKLRKGMKIGVKVTLRNNRMYDFLYKLIHIVLPRVRDFHGISNKSFDGFGNYCLGIKDQLIFPDIDYNIIKKSRGMSINIITTAKNNFESYILLKKLGMPFEK